MQACDTTTRKISIHALREEGDISKKSRYKTRKANFYPRPPRGGRPLRFLPGLLPDYFYPRPPRGGRPYSKAFSRQKYEISIHALREEGDGSFSQFILDLDTFLSTPSARRATRIAQRKDDLAGDFYPRPPRGGRPSRVATDYIEESISIHALREEGDSSVIRLPELS